MYPIPVNDQYRLEALAQYDILDTAPEEAFDRLTRLAKRQFDVSIALVSFVDLDRQWFKSHDGLDASETHRELAFCAHAILNDETMVVLDASIAPRFRENALVTGDPGIRFYAGAPLKTPEGFRLGTFCLIDTKPRAFFNAGDITALEDYARLVMEILEFRRIRQPEVSRSSNGGQISTAASTETFSLVAHEIRSPIATIIGMMRVIEGRSFGPLSDPRYESFFSDMSDAAEHLGQVTDRMLDYARLGTGDIEIQEDRIVARNLLQDSEQEYLANASEHEVGIEIVPPDRELVFQADPTLMRQMVGNLLANAIKFSPEGGVVRLSARRDAANHLIIEVSDDGSGISDEDIRVLELSIDKLRKPGATPSGGTGLGLSLVKLLVEVHGGRLELSRKDTGGTRAILRLPGFRLENEVPERAAV